jgi:hypothetical protein
LQAGCGNEQLEAISIFGDCVAGGVVGEHVCGGVGVGVELGTALRRGGEPIAVLLSLITVAVMGMVAYFGVELRARAAELEEEKYSAPRALAYGYVRNFIVPLVTRLITQPGARADDVRLYVFIPEQLSDLEPDAVERTMARMRAKQFETKVVNLELDQGRPRDVLTIMKGGGINPVYFDFPNTLLTLKPVVDFKLRKSSNTSPEQERRELGARFIQRFREELEKLLAQTPDVAEHVKLTDKRLKFLDAPAAN